VLPKVPTAQSNVLSRDTARASTSTLLLDIHLVITINVNQVEALNETVPPNQRGSAMPILREGFKDRFDPTGTNLGFYDQIPEIKAVWFNEVPLDGDEGPLLLLEISDIAVQQLDTTVRMGLWGRSSLPHFSRYRSNIPEVDEEGKFWREYIVPAEVANQYGPPTDTTDSE